MGSYCCVPCRQEGQDDLQYNFDEVGIDEGQGYELEELDDVELELFTVNEDMGGVSKCITPILRFLGL